MAGASTFLALRLIALSERPIAFDSSTEEEATTLVAIENQLGGSDAQVFFGAFDGAQLIGTIFAFSRRVFQRASLGRCTQLYVVSSARSSGVGAELLRYTLALASQWPGLERLKLTVTADNGPAVRLYQKHAFVEVGRVPKALHVGQTYFDELILVRGVG
jgi:RimJ/RimL family protein N-acetyltransferase